MKFPVMLIGAALHGVLVTWYGVSQLGLDLTKGNDWVFWAFCGGISVLGFVEGHLVRELE